MSGGHQSGRSDSASELGVSRRQDEATNRPVRRPPPPLVHADPLVHHLPQGWINVDAQHRLIACNPRFIQMVHHAPQQPIGCPLGELWPDLARTIGPLIDGIYETAQPLADVGFRSLGPAEETRYYRADLYPISDATHKVVSVAAIIADVTREHHATEIICQSEAQFRAMFDISGLGKVQSDARTGRMLRVNPRFCQLTGYTAAELVGRRFVDMVFPDDRPRKQNAFDRLIHGELAEYRDELRYLRKSGGTVWASLNVRVIHDEHGQPLSTIASVEDITDRKANEDALRSSERRFASLIDAMPQIVWLTNADGVPVAANPRWVEYFGVGIDQAGPTLWRRIVHRHEYTRVMRKWKQALATGESLSLECRLRGRDDTYRWFIVRGEPIREGDSIALWCGTLTDIHDHRQAQAAAERGQRLFQSIAEATPDILFIHDLAERRIIYANRELFSTLGWMPQYIEQLNEQQLLEMVHPDDRAAAERFYTEFETAADGEILSCERRIRHRDGGWRWFSIRVTVFARTPEGRPSQVLGLATDITRRKEYEEALRRTTQHNERTLAQLQSIVQAMNEGLAICDPLGQSMVLNRAALEMHGLSNDVRYQGHIPVEMLAGMYELFDLNDQPLAREHWPIYKTLQGESFGNYEVKIRAKETGTVRIYSFSGAPVLSAEGKIILGMVTMRDITERKTAEQELQLAKQKAEDASRAKDHFLATLSHELRTPLTPVLMTAHALLHDPNLPPCLRADIETIRRNVELEARLIDDLLDLTRIARQTIELHREVVDLHGVVEHALRICREGLPPNKRLDCRLELQAERHLVWADPARMQQVFWNLINNAMKFTDAGGCITIRSFLPSPQVVRVEVVDNGLGIEPDRLTSIFNAFEQGDRQVTRRYGGLGLGLAICKSLMDLHGGSITAHSAGRGCGATFAIEMPLANDAPPVGCDATIDPPCGAVQGGCRRWRLLLVEDHETTARVLRRLLESEQFEISTAANVQQALELADRQPFDVVVSDLGLPDGSGTELMQALRRRNPELRGIAVSGFGMEEDRRRSYEAGFARHLVKPISFRTLRETLREIIS